MVMTKFDDNEIIRVRQGWAKVVLNFPSSVNVVLLRYDTVLQRILTVRDESCLEIVLNLKVK